MSVQIYKIIDGPRAELIWDHAKHSMDQEVSIPVRFVTDRVHAIVDYSGTMPRIVLSPTVIKVGHEDGSGQSLILKGHIGGKPFTGWYNARTRRGTFEVKTN